jgi:hypothetical protein
MNAAREMTSCEVCGNASLQPVLDLGPHPLCDDLVPVGDGRLCREYPIDIAYCARCATGPPAIPGAQARALSAHVSLPLALHRDVLNGMSALVDSCEQRLSGLTARPCSMWAATTRSLLDFCKAKGAKDRGPRADRRLPRRTGPRHAIYNGFFSEETAGEIRAKHGGPDVVTFTNVFAHIEDLPAVVAALKALMSPATMLVIENHYLGAVLERQQFDTFYHEHPRTYSLTSFMYIARSLGVTVSGVEFPSRYGGNIRVFMNGPVVDRDSAAVDAVMRKEAGYGAQFARSQRTW